MNFLEKHWKLMMGGFLALVIIGLGVIGAMYLGQNKEMKAQEEYFLIEKNYLQATNPSPTKENPKPEASKDLATHKKAFEDLMTKYPKTKASQMSSLYLSKIYISENNPQKALEILQKNLTSSSDLISALVQQKTGQIQADLGQCKDAINTWDKIVNDKSLEFLHSEVKIQQALCYEKTNDLKKAEEILTNVANQKPDQQNSDTASIQQAEKYLRMIQFQKSSGS